MSFILTAGWQPPEYWCMVLQRYEIFGELPMDGVIFFRLSGDFYVNVGLLSGSSVFFVGTNQVRGCAQNGFLYYYAVVALVGSGFWMAVVLPSFSMAVTLTIWPLLRPSSKGAPT